VKLFRQKNCVQSSSIILWNNISNPKTVYTLRISSYRSTKWCDNLGPKNFNFPAEKNCKSSIFVLTTDTIVFHQIIEEDGSK